MAAASSPATDEAYGVRRVCAAWGMPRSSFYAARTVSEAPTPGRRRGPRPVVDDAGLLEAIRRDLDRSPFSGKGHRKVWARLRFIQPDEGGRDVFVHISAVERSGLRGLAEGQKVSYERQADRRTGKESAANLKSA